MAKDAAAGKDFAVRLLEDAPEIQAPEAFYWRCFGELSCDRPLVAMLGFGLLPRSVIRDLGKELGFEEPSLQYFVEGVRYVELEERRLQAHNDKRPSSK